MQDALLDRLQVALDKVLEQNRLLGQRCDHLTQERVAWEAEKATLLADVERVLTRFDSLDLEGL